jgi:hypothetical protein
MRAMTMTDYQRKLLRIANLAAFYRANPHRYVKDFLHINLKLFQKILIYLMNVNDYFMFIACRGIGKTFLTAIYCVVRCILYPGTKICIAAGNRSQSVNILEYIRDELMPNSPELRAEIKDGPITTASNAYVTFHNGSRIKVVTASDSSRGNRCNVLVCDEFRMINENVITTVLRKFLTSRRHPKYLDKPEYQNLWERNKELYLSSAWFKEHWSYQKMLSFFKNEVDDTKKYFLCALPYQLSIKEGLLDAEAVADEMSEDGFSEIKWAMEMECVFWGDEEGSFFDFASISKNRRVKYPWLPDNVCPKIADPKLRIPKKQPGEVRIISMDIALMASGGKSGRNDATAIMVNSMQPNRDGRYINNIVYTQVLEGAHTEDQALMIRKYFDEFDCDWLVIDAKGVGGGVLDLLLRDIYDKSSDITYPALSVSNDADWAARAPQGAKRVIWAINGSAKLNSDCAIGLREGFRSGRVRMLISEFDAEDLLQNVTGYKKLDAMEKSKIQLPYINTTLAIDEIIHLNHDESSGLVKISERTGARKDRYSSLAYNIYVAGQIEARMRKKRASSISSVTFMFRAPKIK